MDTRTAEDPDADILLPVGTYHIDPARSTVAFTTRHLFGLGRVQGTFALRTGRIRVARPVQQSSVTAVLAADSITTGNSRRDDDVRSAEFLDAAAHPDITFDQAHCSSAELSLHAQARIDRYEFGIAAARGMAARHLDLQLQVVAHAQNPKES